MSDIAKHPPITEDYLEILRQVESGYQPASFLQALGVRCFAFFGRLQPEDFRRVARALVAAALNEQNASCTRVRAIESALMPLRKAATLIPMLMAARESALLLHLHKLLAAFFEEISANDFAGMADTLVQLSAGPIGHRPADALPKLQAIQSLLKHVLAFYDVILRAQALAQEEATRSPRIAPNDPRLLEVKRELQDIEAEIAAEEQDE